MKGLSSDLVATLCFGLQSNSRVKMKLSNSKITLEQTLLARIADELAFQSWTKTKDGQKNRNRPPSMLKAMLEEDKKDETVVFNTLEDFNAAWENIING